RAMRKSRCAAARVRRLPSPEWPPPLTPRYPYQNASYCTLSLPDRWARSLGADGEGGERRAHSRTRGWGRPAKILECALEMAKVGDDVRRTDHAHRPNADDLAGLAGMPCPCDDRAIALAHVLDDDAAFEALGHS